MELRSQRGSFQFSQGIIHKHLLSDKRNGNWRKSNFQCVCVSIKCWLKILSTICKVPNYKIQIWLNYQGGNSSADMQQYNKCRVEGNRSSFLTLHWFAFERLTVDCGLLVRYTIHTSFHIIWSILVLDLMRVCPKTIYLVLWL
jgi:hypothetical protein